MCNKRERLEINEMKKEGTRLNCKNLILLLFFFSPSLPRPPALLQLVIFAKPFRSCRRAGAQRLASWPLAREPGTRLVLSHGPVGSFQRRVRECPRAGRYCATQRSGVIIPHDLPWGEPLCLVLRALVDAARLGGLESRLLKLGAPSMVFKIPQWESSGSKAEGLNTFT